MFRKTSTQHYPCLQPSALPEDILAGKVTEVYFQRTRQILEKLGRPARVVAQFILKKFPPGYKCGILTGLEEALTVFMKLPVTVRALPEGSLFYEDEPILEIERNYLDFGPFEDEKFEALRVAEALKEDFSWIHTPHELHFGT